MITEYKDLYLRSQRLLLENIPVSNPMHLKIQNVIESINFDTVFRSEQLSELFKLLKPMVIDKLFGNPGLDTAWHTFCSVFSICSNQIFTIVVGSKVINLSCELLSAQSFYFKSLLSSGTKEAQEKKLVTTHSKLSDEEQEAEITFFQCLERWSAESIDSNNVLLILPLSQIYGVPWLTEFCIGYIVEHLFVDIDTVLTIIKEIAIPYQFPSLLKDCINFLYIHKNELTDDEGEILNAVCRDNKLLEIGLIFTKRMKTKIELKDGLFEVSFNPEFSSEYFYFEEILLFDSWQIFPIKIYWTNSYYYKPSLKDISFINHVLLKANVNSVVFRDICFNVVDFDQMMSKMANNKSITSLVIKNSENFANSIAKVISTNSYLLELDIGSNNFNEFDVVWILKSIVKNMCLKKVCLSGLKLNEEGIELLIQWIEQNKNLHELDLRSLNLLPENIIKISYILLISNISYINLNYNLSNRESRNAVKSAIDNRRGASLKIDYIHTNSFDYDRQLPVETVHYS